MLDALLNKNSVSIYCFINEQDKRVHIAYAIETLGSVIYNIEKCKGGLQEDVGKVEFRTIETYSIANLLYLKWRVQELYNEYKIHGYTFYTAYKPLQWHLYVGVGRGSDTGATSSYKAIVKLRTSNNVVYEIQCFDTLKEATKFVQGNTISTVVRLLRDGVLMCSK